MFGISNLFKRFLEKYDIFKKHIYKFKFSTLIKYLFISFFLVGLLESCDGIQDVSLGNNAITSSYLSWSTSNTSFFINQTKQITLSLKNTSGVTNPVVVSIVPSKFGVVQLNSDSCSLTTAHNSCTVSITALSLGTVTLNAKASGYVSATTTLTVANDSIVTLTASGVVYLDGKVLKGNSNIAFIDNNMYDGQVDAITTDKNGKLYAATYNSNFDLNINNVYTYDESTNSWVLFGPSVLEDEKFNTTSIIADSSTGTVYMAVVNTSGDTGKLYKYVAGAKEWQQVWPEDSENHVVGLTLDKQGIVYAGTNDGKVYKLDNNSWVEIGTTLPMNGSVNIISIDDNENIYAGVDYYVYKLENNNWILMGSSGIYNPYRVTSVLFANNNLYAATEFGQVYKWGGAIWESVAANKPDPTANVGVSSLAFINNYLFAATTSGQVYKFNNTAWEAISNNSLKIGSGKMPLFILPDTKGGLYITVREGEAYRYNANNQLQPLGFNSSNDGLAINDLITDANKNIYIATDGGFVYKYANGGTEWQKLSASTVQNGAYALSLAINKSTQEIYVGLSNGNVYKFKNGIWQEVGNLSGINGSQDITGLLVDDKGIIYAGADNGRVYKFTGSSWLPIGHSSLSSYTSAIKPVLVDSAETVYVMLDDGTIFRCINNGDWEQIENGLPTDYFATSLLINENTLYSTTLNGIFQLDTTGTWNPALNLNNSFGMITGIAMDSSSNLYIATFNGKVLVYDKSTPGSVVDITPEPSKGVPLKMIKTVR